MPEIDVDAVSAILFQGFVTLVIALIVGALAYRRGERKANERHQEQMRLAREKFEEEKRRWEQEQREKNRPGLTHWNIKP